MINSEDTLVTAGEASLEEFTQERTFRFLDPLDSNPLRAASPEGIVGSILQHEDGQQWNRELLERFMEQGIITDENGDICDPVVIPSEIVHLPQGRTGVMVASNLSACHKGLFWMLDPRAAHMTYDDGIQNVFRSLADLAYAVHVLSEVEHCALKTWDGHQLFFNLDYGITAMVLDGVDMVEHAAWSEDTDPKQYTNDALAAALLYALTGAWPDREESPVGIPENGERLYFTDEKSEPSGSEAILARWETLPEQLRAAFIKANNAPITGYITALEWVKLLKFDLLETAKCPCCGRQHPDGARRCLFCGQETSKKDLWVRFLAKNDLDSTAFAISFGRGVVLNGTHIASSLPGGPLLRLIYNGKQNNLGLRNLGVAPWLVCSPDGTQTIAPGGILTICEEQRIILDQAGTVCLEFQKYEVSSTCL